MLSQCYLRRVLALIFIDFASFRVAGRSLDVISIEYNVVCGTALTTNSHETRVSREQIGHFIHLVDVLPRSLEQ